MQNGQNDDKQLSDAFFEAARQSPNWPEIKARMEEQLAAARTPLPASSSAIIGRFCEASGRKTYDFRSHAQCFPKEALEAAMQSGAGPQLRASMEALASQADFLNPRVSTAIAGAERQLHQHLISTLLEVARDPNKHAPERLKAWIEWDAVRSVTSQGNPS